MPRKSVTLASIAIVAIVGTSAVIPPKNACAANAEVSYAEDIAPIFKGWCVSCHQPSGEGAKASGLDLTTYEGVMKGTKFGPMVIPGKPDESNLMVLVQGQAKIRMPFGHKPLANCLRQNLWTWIFEGAKNN
jgi:hypothetical protein